VIDESARIGLRGPAEPDQRLFHLTQTERINKILTVIINICSTIFSYYYINLCLYSTSLFPVRVGEGHLIAAQVKTAFWSSPLTLQGSKLITCLSPLTHWSHRVTTGPLLCMK